MSKEIRKNKIILDIESEEEITEKDRPQKRQAEASKSVYIKRKQRGKKGKKERRKKKSSSEQEKRDCRLQTIQNRDHRTGNFPSTTSPSSQLSSDAVFVTVDGESWVCHAPVLAYPSIINRTFRATTQPQFRHQIRNIVYSTAVEGSARAMWTRSSV